MNRERVDGWCERGILGLVLAIMVYGPLAFGGNRPLPFLVIQGLTLGVILLWGARFWLSARPRLLWPPICWAVVAFSAYAIGRYLTADIEYVARQEVTRVLVYAFLFLAILNNLHRQESTQVITLTLIFLAMAISFYAGYQFLTNSDRVWHLVKPYPHRGSGTYISPNNLAGFLEMLLPLGLAYTLAGRLKAVTRVLVGYASLVILAGIAVTISRGGWIATALALMLFFGVLVFQRNYRLPSIVLLAVLAAGIAFYLPRNFFFQMRLKQMVEQGKADDDTRFALWQPAAQIWKENVWWGAGPAHFDYRFRAFRPQKVQLRPDRVHNDYLNTLADWGVAGTALVASAWVLLALGVVKTWRVVRGSSSGLGDKPGSNKFALVLGASCGLVAILAHSVVDFNMHVPANAILAVALMALLSAHLRFATDRYWVGAGWGIRILASLVLVAGLAGLGGQAWRRAREYAWQEQAARAPSFSAAKLAGLKGAFAVEPKNAETAYAIGELLRQQSQEGGEAYEGQAGRTYRQLAEEAMQWFDRSLKLDRWNGYSYLGYGWCLDWLDRPAESRPYFDRAEQLDRNGYFTMAKIGLHYVQLGDFAAAKPWFERSLRLQVADNPIARNYLQIANARLMQAATNAPGAGLNFSPR